MTEFLKIKNPVIQFFYRALLFVFQ